MENKEIKCVIPTLSFGDIETKGVIKGNNLFVGQQVIDISKIKDRCDIIKVKLTLGIAPLLWVYDREDFPSIGGAVILYKPYKKETWSCLVDC